MHIVVCEYSRHATFRCVYIAHIQGGKDAYGVATISRLLKMMSLSQNIVSFTELFCKRDL